MTPRRAGPSSPPPLARRLHNRGGPDHDRPRTDKLTERRRRAWPGPEAEKVVVSSQRGVVCGLRLSSIGSSSSRGAASCPQGFSWHHRINAWPSSSGRGSARGGGALLAPMWSSCHPCGTHVVMVVMVVVVIVLLLLLPVGWQAGHKCGQCAVVCMYILVVADGGSQTRRTRT